MLNTIYFQFHQEAFGVFKKKMYNFWKTLSQNIEKQTIRHTVSIIILFIPSCLCVQNRMENRDS